MSNLEPLWKQARERYVRSIEKASDRTAFEAAFDGIHTPEEFVANLQVSRSSSKDGKTSRALERLDALLSPLREVAPIFDVVSQINSLIGCSIWGPLKLILLVVYPLVFW